MPAPTSQIPDSQSCAHCGKTLPSTSFGIGAWCTGNKFVCNEFCADGILLDGAQTLERPNQVVANGELDERAVRSLGRPQGDEDRFSL
jgi:hypothetical protein